MLNRIRKHHFEYLDYIEKKLADISPDIICITGDLSQLGTFEELEKAEIFLNHIDNLCKRVLLVSGNHDMYITDSKATTKLMQILNKYGTDDIMDVEIDGVCFILLNQCINNKLFRFQGSISQQNLEKLSNTLEKNNHNKKIILGHFPLIDNFGNALPQNRRLLEYNCVLSLFEKKIPDLYLCGHIHTAYDIKLPGGCRQLCAGSITKEGIIFDIDITSEGTPTCEQKSILKEI